MNSDSGQLPAPDLGVARASATQPAVLADRPFWLSILRWMAWLAMLALVLTFAAKGGGGAFIYQNF